LSVRYSHFTKASLVESFSTSPFAMIPSWP
jgi:hypothetical protein